MNVYGHLLPSVDDALAARLDAVRAAAVEPAPETVEELLQRADEAR